MTSDFLKQHFQKSGLHDMQADALAAYFEHVREEVATKHDVNALRRGMAGLRAELQRAQAALRNELKFEMHAELLQLKTDLTWRFVALVAFLGTVLTAANVYLS